MIIYLEVEIQFVNVCYKEFVLQTIISKVLEKQLNRMCFAAKEIMFISNFQGCSVNQNVQYPVPTSNNRPFLNGYYRQVHVTYGGKNTDRIQTLSVLYAHKFWTALPLFSICAYRTHVSHTITRSLKEPYIFQLTVHHQQYLSHV